MQDFDIQSRGDQIVITVDRSLMSLEALNRLFERLRVEQLVKKRIFAMMWLRSALRSNAIGGGKTGNST